VSYLHGFNLGKNGSIGYTTLIETVPLVCKALAGDKLASWQLGNEPDLYKTSSQGPVRPSWWNEAAYVQEYLNKTHTIRDIVSRDCPDVIADGKFKFYSPSFAGTSNSLNLIRAWQAGLDSDHEIAYVDSHNYIGGATQPGVTLQGTLMNHTSTVLSVNKHLNESTLLHAGIPYILGETNSLYNEGAPGLSNSFGAALWGVDFNLYCAATGIQRVHMHQGTNYRYASWQPIQTVNETKGTKAPYYGNIAVAKFLGDLTKDNVSISDIELGSTYENAYAAYVNDRLERIALIQMQAFNYTNSTGPRPSETYRFQLPHGCSVRNVGVQRLMANGSDAITGITFDGYSYNYDLDSGRPVLLNNVTRGEVVEVGSDGTLEVKVPWSSAVILNMQW
jgi:Glycosyl hydrolase family 79 C-terminal beta domain